MEFLSTALSSLGSVGHIFAVTYTTTTTTSTNSSSYAGLYIIDIVLILILLASYWKIFTKAGKPGWAAIIPIYNLIVMLRIIGRPVWWIFLFLIPIVNIVVYIVVIFDLVKAYGRGIGFGILTFFFPYIMYPILGFGGSKYVGAGGESAPPQADTTPSVVSSPPVAPAPPADVTPPPTPVATPSPESTPVPESKPDQQPPSPVQ